MFFLENIFEYIIENHVHSFINKAPSFGWENFVSDLFWLWLLFCWWIVILRWMKHAILLFIERRWIELWAKWRTQIVWYRLGVTCPFTRWCRWTSTVHHRLLRGHPQYITTYWVDIHSTSPLIYHNFISSIHVTSVWSVRYGCINYKSKKGEVTDPKIILKLRLKKNSIKIVIQLLP